MWILHSSQDSTMFISIVCSLHTGFRKVPLLSSNVYDEAQFHMIPFQSERATFSMDDAIVTTHIAKHITHAKTAPAMKSYITEKTDWSEATFNKVDWEATETYMKKVSIATRAKVTKLMHNW